MILLSRRDLLKHLGACACGLGGLKFFKPSIIVGQALAAPNQPARSCVIITQEGGQDQFRAFPPVDSNLVAKLQQLRTLPGGTYIAPPAYTVFSQVGVPGINQAWGAVVRNQFLTGHAKLINRYGAHFLNNDVDDRSHAIKSNQVSYGMQNFNAQASEGYLAKARRLFELDVHQVFHFGKWRPECRALDDANTPISAMKASDLVYENFSGSNSGLDGTEQSKALAAAKELWNIRKNSSNALDKKIASSLLQADEAAQYFHPITSIPVSGTYDQGVFGQAMKGVTQLIKYNASLSTPRNLIIHVVTPSIWDSHSDTPGVDGSISLLGSNLGAVISDLVASNLWNQTVIFTESEFGRRNIVNGSNGTEHGRGNIHFVMGGSVAGGFIGAPFTEAEISQESLAVDVAFQNVFAQVFAWMGFNSSAIEEIYNPAEYPQQNLNLFT